MKNKLISISAVVDYEVGPEEVDYLMDRLCKLLDSEQVCITTSDYKEEE